MYNNPFVLSLSYYYYLRMYSSPFMCLRWSKHIFRNCTLAALRKASS